VKDFVFKRPDGTRFGEHCVIHPHSVIRRNENGALRGHFEDVKSYFKHPRLESTFTVFEYSDYNRNKLQRVTELDIRVCST
jgi:hypothetical protein